MAYTTINKSTDYFNTKLWTGTGSSNALTGVGFQPDWTWIKNRTDAQSHVLQDAVRGVGNTIISNNTDAQSAEGAGDLTAFGSDGFTVGTNGRVNGSGKSIVAWNWKAGTGQGSANTDGSINTTYTSVNTTAGFSISKYVGTGSNATVGHGLGVAPKVVITKNLDTADNWTVYHESLGNTKGVFLNLSNTPGTSSAYWNNTTPTSSVFSVGTEVPMNKSGDNIIAYCFAEKTGYNKFGSYTGNGSTDGTFVYTGFKPAFVMIKITNDTGENWQMYDNKRTGFNVDNNMLRANLTDAEQTDDDIDLLSNGFKLRRSSGAFNSDGANYIYMAFAEAPLVGTNGVTAKAR